MMGLILFCWNNLRYLEEVLVSDGHLQFMEGAVVFRAEWVRIFHVWLLLTAAIIADRVFCRKLPGDCKIFVFLCVILAALWLGLGFDTFLLTKEPGIVPIPDRYHKQFEAKWQQDPEKLLIEKGLVQPSILEIDGEHFLYLMNYDGMFDNDFAFVLDREKGEIRIPADGNGRFLRQYINESSWHTPGAVTAEVLTDMEPCRPLLFSGGYDSKREEFVIPLTGPVQDARYGYCTVYWSGTDYTARQLFGERYQVRLWDLLRGKR